MATNATTLKQRVSQKRFQTNHANHGPRQPSLFQIQPRFKQLLLYKISIRPPSNTRSR